MKNGVHTGKVKWFCPEKGFGFILLETGDEAFVHYSSIVDEGFRVLNVDELVEFELLDTIKGYQAKNVKRLRKLNGHAEKTENAESTD